jgi:K+-sensing histidine kinase KdpD
MRELPLRIAIMAAALLVAAVGIGAAAVFLCLALYSLLLTPLSAPLAALAAAALVFILSLLVIFLGSALANGLARRARHARAKRGGAAVAFSAELGKILGEDAQKFIAGKPVLTLLLALAGGFAVGVSPRLRALLQTLLKY